MTTTPIGPLVAFCVAMTAIAVGRLVRDDDRDPVDVGSALIALGVTWFTALWLAHEYAWVATPARTLLALVGGTIVAAGLGLMVRHWNGEPSALVAARQRSVGDDVASDSETDGDRDRA